MATTTGETPTRKTTTSEPQMTETQMTDTQLREAVVQLLRHGIGRCVAEKATEIAKEHGAFTIFALVDALTRMAGKVQNAGDRVDLDRDAGRLLALAV